MSLKGRLNRIQDKLPRKEKKDERDEPDKKVASWLIKNGHKEYMECLERTWIICMKGDIITPGERAEYDKLIIRLNEIVEEYSQKEQFV